MEREFQDWIKKNKRAQYYSIIAIKTALIVGLVVTLFLPLEFSIWWKIASPIFGGLVAISAIESPLTVSWAKEYAYN